MTVAEVADLERVVADYLRANDVRTVALPPSEKQRASSWVRVILLGVNDGGDPDHIIRGMLQLDCYAGSSGGQPEATALAREVRALLKNLAGTQEDGVVFGEVRIIGHARIPDYDMEPSRERVILTATFVHHATPEGS